MASQTTKPPSKKKSAGKAGTKKSPSRAATKKKVVSAKASAPATRKPKATKQHAKGAAPVLVNAVKPEEKLSEAAMVERALDSIEQSMQAALPAAVAVNLKLVDIAQTNVNAGLELVRDLVRAKSPLEAMRFGMDYWHAHMSVFEAQAQELRTLSAALMTTASEPIRANLTRAWR